MNAWIPESVAVVWVALFVLVVVTHVAHAAMIPGQHRLWHAGHVLMAAGMVVMFWPTKPLLGMSAAAGIWIYAMAAGVLAVGLTIAWWRGVPLGMLWLVSVIDFMAMAYMFVMMSTALAWLSVLAGIWFTAQTIGWISGWLDHVRDGDGLRDAISLTQPTDTTFSADSIQPGTGPQEHLPCDTLASHTPGSQDSTQGTPGSGPSVATHIADLVTATRKRVPDGGAKDLSVRITLAVMATGMGYMILAMQYGMAGML